MRLDKNVKHTHHIIPRHMGGTDDPENLIELSVEDHAEAHRKLWEEYGNKKDYAAWKGLSGTIGKEEIVRLLMDPTGRTHTEETKDKMRKAQLGKKKHTPESKKKISDARKGKTLSEEHKKKIGEKSKGRQTCLGKKLTEEHKEKLRKAAKGNKNAKGPQNISEEGMKKRSEATKERWAKYRAERGIE